MLLRKRWGRQANQWGRHLIRFGLERGDGTQQLLLPLLQPCRTAGYYNSEDGEALCGPGGTGSYHRNAYLKGLEISCTFMAGQWVLDTAVVTWLCGSTWNGATPDGYELGRLS